MGPSLAALAHFPRSFLPRILFRACVNREEHKEELVAHALTVPNSTHTPFLELEVESFRGEVDHHLKLRYRTRPSQLMSWSSSLLATVQRALHLQLQGWEEVSVVALDTSKLTDVDVVLPVSYLIDIFEMDEWNNYALQHFSIEYLIYQSLGASKIEEVRLKTLIKYGLEDLCPELFVKIAGIGNEKVWLRYQALQDKLFGSKRNPAPVSIWKFDLAYQLATKWTTSGELHLRLHIAFLALESRQPLTGSFLNSIRAEFATLYEHGSPDPLLPRLADPELASTIMPELQCYTRLMAELDAWLRRFPIDVYDESGMTLSTTPTKITDGISENGDADNDSEELIDIFGEMEL